MIKTLDTNTTNIDTDGSLLTDPNLFTIGISGPLVNPVVKYYESPSTKLLYRSQVEIWITQDYLEARRLNGESFEETNRRYREILRKEEDLFVIQIFEDSEGRTILLMYGFGPMGTMASGCYLENVMLEDPASFESAWIIVSGNDTNQNNQVDPPDSGDTYTIVTAGENFWD